MIELETRLAEVGARLAVPEAAGLAARVGAELRATQAAGGAASWWSPGRRRIAAIVAAIALALGGAAIAPALAEWLGLRGVRVHDEPAPRRPSVPLGSDLQLGTAVSLAEAERAVDFSLVISEQLGPSSAAWIDRTGVVPVVSFVYEDAVVSQFRANLPSDGILHKFARPNVAVEQLTIEGHRALWFDGVHEVAVEARGEPTLLRLRYSDSALLVEQGEITVRIETRLGRDEAVRIAELLA